MDSDEDWFSPYKSSPAASLSDMRLARARPYKFSSFFDYISWRYYTQLHAFPTCWPASGSSTTFPAWSCPCCRCDSRLSKSAFHCINESIVHSNPSTSCKSCSFRCFNFPSNRALPISSVLSATSSLLRSVSINNCSHSISQRAAALIKELILIKLDMRKEQEALDEQPLTFADRTAYHIMCLPNMQKVAEDKGKRRSFHTNCENIKSCLDTFCQTHIRSLSLTAWRRMGARSYSILKLLA